MIIEKYFEYLDDLFSEVRNNEVDNIEKAADLVTESVKNGGRFYVFGSGHSHMVAEEIYIRAGGLAFVKAILPGELMLHEMPNKSTYLERLNGYSEAILKLYKVDKNDTLMVVSNSGRNNVPVEMCKYAKEEIGCNVIALTSLKHATSQKSRHSSGKLMHEFADVVLDTHAPKGDACFKVNDIERTTGPVSSFLSIAIANALIIKTIENLNTLGLDTPIFKSSNLDGADEYNNKLFDEYYGYWK